MKKLFIPFYIFILFSSLIFSCKKKNEDPSPISSNQVVLKAKPGMVYFEGNGTSAELPVRADIKTTSNLKISGVDFSLQLDTVAGILGTYQITPTNSTRYITLNLSGYWASYGNPGQVVITGIDRVNQTISGYFTITLSSASGTKIFTGDFKDVFFPAKSTMSSVIGGAAWAAAAPTYGNALFDDSKTIITSGNGGGFFTPSFFSINLKNPITVTTYNLSLSGNYTITYSFYVNDVFIQYKATSGQVVITKYDAINKILIGTFDAVLQETGGASILNVTNGEFNIQLP
jgi:hypothetical protein